MSPCVNNDYRKNAAMLGFQLEKKNVGKKSIASMNTNHHLLMKSNKHL